MLRRMFAVLAVTIGAGLGMGGCHAHGRALVFQNATGTTIEHTVPAGECARFDLLALRSDRKAVAPVSIVVAGNTRWRSAQVALDITEETIEVGGVQIPFQRVSLRLDKGFAFASISDPVVFAAAPVAGMLVQDDLDQPDPQPVATFFPVIWIRDLEAGAPGTKLIVQATEPGDRGPQGDEDIRLILVEGDKGMTSRLGGGAPETHVDNCLDTYWFFTRGQRLGGGPDGLESKGPRTRNRTVNNFVTRAKKIAKDAGVP